MSTYASRREFLRNLGIGAAAVPFVMNLPSLGYANTPSARRQRLIVMFSPNGVIPKNFWPDEYGEEFALKESLTPLESLKDRTLLLHGHIRIIDDLHWGPEGTRGVQQVVKVEVSFLCCLRHNHIRR